MLGTNYILGLDLGQQHDYSILSILEIFVSEALEVTYVLRYLKEYRLRTDYVSVVADVTSIVESERLHGKNVLVVDCSGVGRPVMDLFRSGGVNPIGLTITSGSSSRWIDSVNVNVSKREIVSCIQIVCQNKRFKIPSDLQLIDKVKKEFLGFKARISKAGASTFEAAGSGMHDDIVMSLGIALWYGEEVNRRGRKVRLLGGN